MREIEYLAEMLKELELMMHESEDGKTVSCSAEKFVDTVKRIRYSIGILHSYTTDELAALQNLICRYQQGLKVDDDRGNCYSGVFHDIINPVEMELFLLRPDCLSNLARTWQIKEKSKSS